MKKNDIVTLTIEDFTKEGLGIGHCEGLALFVKDTVIGDVAEVKIMKMKKSYGYARLQRIVRASPDRVCPFCPCARSCGGCQIQQMSYAAQLKFKEQKVGNDLKRIGGLSDPPLEPVIGMTDAAVPPMRFRNKTQVPIAREKDGGLVAGFYAGRTHRVVKCADCLIGPEVNRQILTTVLAHMQRHEIDPYEERSQKGLVRHVLIRVNRAALEGREGAQILLGLVINGAEVPEKEELIEALLEIPGMTGILINLNRENTNVILGEETRLLWGKEYLEDTIGGIRFHISLQSFYQVNPFQTEKLYEKVLEYAALTGTEVVWDLYCGIGTISLFLAKNAAAVYGVECVPEAVRDAKENARINGITNAEFFAAKAEEILPQRCRRKEAAADVIVADPPRRGCDALVLSAILQIRPERIVYVSCDSATLARDLRRLCEGGYEVKRACPVDLFCHTVHVETVVQLMDAGKERETCD